MRVQCSTCLELLTPEDDLTSTPCGHVFHLACVVQWFETKKNCPQCRHSANERTLRKIFLAETDGATQQDPDDLQNQLDNAQFQLRLKEAEKSKLSDRNKEVENLLRQQKDEIKKIEHDKRKYKEQAEGMRTQNRVLQEEHFKYETALKFIQNIMTINFIVLCIHTGFHTYLYSIHTYIHICIQFMPVMFNMFLLLFSIVYDICLLLS